MKRSAFLLIAAILSFVFGAMMFFIPALAAKLLGIAATPETASVLRGMGGLIIGSGTINFLVRNFTDIPTLKAVLLTNIITHLLGLTADIWGILDGVLTVSNMLPVELTHIFVGAGSLIYLLRLKKASAI